MNKLFITTFLIALGLGMASCSEQNTPNKTDAKATTETTTEVKNEDEPIVLEGDVQEEAAETPSTKATGKVRKLTTQEFIDEIFDYKSSPSKWIYKGNRPAIIDFYADWCGPCKRVAPIMDELAEKYAGKVNFYKINTDEEGELAGRVFGIRSIPSILFIPAQGQPLMYTGAFPKNEYIKLINEKLNVK